MVLHMKNMYAQKNTRETQIHSVAHFVPAYFAGKPQGVAPCSEDLSN